MAVGPRLALHAEHAAAPGRASAAAHGGSRARGDARSTSSTPLLRTLLVERGAAAVRVAPRPAARGPRPPLPPMPPERQREETLEALVALRAGDVRARAGDPAGRGSALARCDDADVARAPDRSGRDRAAAPGDDDPSQHARHPVGIAGPGDADRARRARAARTPSGSSSSCPAIDADPSRRSSSTSSPRPTACRCSSRS